MVAGSELFFSLFNNLAIFIALIALYGALINTLNRYGSFVRQLIVGGLFGFFAIGCMHAKIPVYEGVIVDQRNAIIALSGLCGGPISALISAFLAGLFRMYLGGGGVLAGVFGVFLAATAGICLNKFFRKFDTIPKAIFGSFLAAVIILPGFLLVGDIQTGWNLMKAMSVPYGTAIFIGIALGGLLINRQEFLYKIEEEFRESEERFRTLANTSPLAIYMSEGIEQKAVYVNPKFTTLFGYTIDEVPSAEHWWTLAYPDEEYRKQVEGEWQAKVQHAINTNTAIEPMEVVVTSKSGVKKYISWFFFTIGKQNWAYGLDLTERKQAEEQKKVLETQLNESQKLEAIGMLAGGVAHDLNNILSGIVSYPELLLLDVPEESPMYKPLTIIQQSGLKASAVVQDLLILARRGVAVTKVVNLNQIITDYLRSPEHKKMLEMNVAVNVNVILDPNLLNIFGSPIHLSKTIMNLVSNAIEACSTEGSVIISTENRYLDQPLKDYDEVIEGEYVMVRVIDDGIGISSEDLEKIFEPFYTNKEMGRSGTGLGMALVSGSIKDHHGYIEIQSKEDVGTKVIVLFPVTRQEIGIELESTGLADFHGNGELILVVDDVEEQLLIAKDILKKLHYNVVVQPSGEEALKYLTDNPVDLVILDMIMDPGIDGLTTYLELQKINPQQKVLITSGYSETIRVKEVLKSGTCMYLGKPYTIRGLAKGVQNALSHTKNAKENILDL